MCGSSLTTKSDNASFFKSTSQKLALFVGHEIIGTDTFEGLTLILIGRSNLCAEPRPVEALLPAQVGSKALVTSMAAPPPSGRAITNARQRKGSSFWRKSNTVL